MTRPTLGAANNDWPPPKTLAAGVVFSARGAFTRGEAAWPGASI